MGLAEWKRRYYPIDARNVEERDALAHSLRKWRGMRPAVLARYNVGSTVGLLRDNHSAEILFINDRTCALCQHYAQYASEPCTDCPLNESRGEISCDCRAVGERVSPYHSWVRKNDPEPMIKALEKAQRWVKRRGRKKK